MYLLIFHKKSANRRFFNVLGSRKKGLLPSNEVDSIIFFNGMYSIKKKLFCIQQPQKLITFFKKNSGFFETKLILIFLSTDSLYEHMTLVDLCTFHGILLSCLAYTMRGKVKLSISKWKWWWYIEKTNLNNELSLSKGSSKLK